MQFPQITIRQSQVGLSHGQRHDLPLSISPLDNTVIIYSIRALYLGNFLSHPLRP
jgi:hypothetical protein